MIKLGRTGYWFDGSTFLVGDREKKRPITDEDRRPLLAYLCACAFGLNRWQGEANENGERWSVGEHSILVAALAGRLALLRGMSPDDARLAVVGGAIHDLGETLGLGDIAAPWLRSAAGTSLRLWCASHQAQVESFIGWSGLLPDLLIKDADHLAAALERRVFFGDMSRNMEHPDAPRLMAEVFGREVDDEEDNDACHLIWPADAETLLALVTGDDDVDPIFMLGSLMIANGKAVGP